MTTTGVKVAPMQPKRLEQDLKIGGCHGKAEEEGKDYPPSQLLQFSSLAKHKGIRQEDSMSVVKAEDLLRPVKVMLKRDGKQQVIVMRKDSALSADRKGTLKYGSGRVWKVLGWVEMV